MGLLGIPVTLAGWKSRPRKQWDQPGKRTCKLGMKMTKPRMEKTLLGKISRPGMQAGQFGKQTVQPGMQIEKPGMKTAELRMKIPT